MTKGKSHRQLFVSKVVNDHFSVKDAAIHCKISYNTGRNWMRMLNRTGNYYPLRHRRSISGVMSLDHQEILQMVISNNRMAMIDEITQSMSEETGFHYSPRLIRQVMSRHKYVSRLANELSPLERDNELMENTFLYVGSLDEKVHIPKSSMLFFRGDMVHAGSDYQIENYRLFISASSIDYPSTLDVSINFPSTK